MESKKINQLATNVAPQTSDLTIIGDPITGVSKKITLLQIANLFATTGTVSSVAVTETGDALTITGSPITSAGTINIGFAGDATQYVRGDGALADFPTSTGGGSSVSYYLNSSVSQGTIGGVAYRELSKDPISGAGTDITISADGYVASYITDANDPALLEVPGGNFNCEFYFSVNSNAHNPYVYAELYKYDGTTFTLLGSSQSVPEYLTNGTTLSPYYFAIPVATAALTITDRLAIRIYANVDTRTVTLHTENNHLCQVVTTFSKGLTSLNNLTRQVQFLATGTSGTDFAITSSTATHTFNLPVASATNTGKLSSTDWSTFNGKQSAITLTTTGTSGAATLVGSTLNIPNYAPDLSNYVTLNTTQTITGYKDFNGETNFNNFVFNNSKVYNYQSSVFLHSATLAFQSLATTMVGVTNGIKFGLGSLATTQFTFNNTVGLVYTFPAASGTLALTSDIPSLSGYIQGSGTTNYVPKFTASGTIGNSSISEAAETGVFVANSLSVQNTLTVTSYVSADAFIPTNSTVPTNGMYRSAANTLAFATNSTNRLTITSTGAATFSSSVTAAGSIFIGTNFAQLLPITALNSQFLTGSYYDGSNVIATAASGTRTIYNSGGFDFRNFTGATIGSSVTDTSRMTITSAGNVGIGTSSPDYPLTVQANSGAAQAVKLLGRSIDNISILSFHNNTNTTQYGYIAGIPTEFRINSGSSLPITFTNADTERMRITSGGQLMVGGTLGLGGRVVVFNEATGISIMDSSNNGGLMRFYNVNAVQIGSITTDASSTFYNTSSDYRLKEDLKEVKGLQKVLSIKTYDYKWKNSELRTDGVIAHELQEVIPYAVHGQKDGEEMQGVDYSKIVPILIKSIQEQQQQIEELKQLINK